MEPAVPRPGTRRARRHRRASLWNRSTAVRSLVLVAAFLVLVALAGAAAAQWPQEGRTPTRNASAPTDGPAADFINGNDDVTLWSANPGREHSADGEAEAMTGAPVLAENTVVVATRGGTVAAYGALQGQQIWDYQIQASENVDDVVGTPAIVDLGTDGHIVVVGARDGIVRGLDLEDGSLRWRTDLDPAGGDSIATSVHARDNRVFVGTEEDVLVALEGGSGDELWRKSGPARLEAGFTSAATSDGDWLYVPTSQQIYRFRPSTGASLNADVAGNLLGAVAVDQEAERIYYGISEGDTQGRAWARNASNFARDWDRRVSSGGLRSDVLDVDGKLYLGNERGTLYSRSAGDGSARWSEDLISSPTYDDALRGLPAEANGTLYVPSEDGLLFGVDASSGDKEWTLNLRSGCGETQLTCQVSSPAVWEEKLYVTTEGGVLWVVGPESAAGPQPPTAEVDVLERGLTVELDASGSSDPNHDPGLTFTWELGDGARVRGEALAYTYREAGNYSVTLTVEDETGRTDSETVTVEATPAPSTPWNGPGGDPGADRATPDAGPPDWTEEWVRSFPGELASDPVMGQGGVVAASEDGTVRAYRLDGDLRWIRDLPDASAVARGNGTVYVAVGDRIQALEADDGADQGNLSLGETVRSLAADGDVVAAGAGNGLMAVWNTSSGDNWTRIHPALIRDGPVIGPDGDRVAVLTVTNNLHVYEADGGVVYKKTELGMEARTLSVDRAALVLSGLRSTGNAGEVRSQELETGVLRWAHEMDREVLDHAAGDRVYVITAGEEVLALNRSADVTDGGREAWSHALGAAPRAGITAAEDGVVVPTAGGVTILDPSEGNVTDATSLDEGTRLGSVHETLAALQRDPLPERSPVLVVAGAVPWEANFTVTPATPEAGETVTFQDASVAPGGAARTFAFGDGNTTSAETATHTYAEAGNYTARLTVDAAGAAPKLVTLKDVEVVPAPTDGTDGDGNDTEPPANDTDDGEPPANGTDGGDGEPPADGGDGDGGTPYRPDAAVPGPEAAAAVLGSVLAAVARRRRARR